MAEAGEGEAGRQLFLADAVGHGNEGAVLQRPRRSQALGHGPAPAPGLLLIVIGDPVGAVDDEIGAEVAQPAHIVGKDEVVADRHPHLAERRVRHARPIAGAANLALAGKEMGLVVDRKALPVRAEEELRIVDAAVALRIGADGHGEPVLPRDRAEALRARPVRRLGQIGEPVAHEVAGGGAFREDHEVGLPSCGLAGEAGDGREVPLRIARGAVHLRDREGPGHAAHVTLPPHAARPAAPPSPSCPDSFRASISAERGGAAWMAGYPEQVRASPAMTRRERGTESWEPPDRDVRVTSDLTASRRTETLPTAPCPPPPKAEGEPRRRRPSLPLRPWGRRGPG